MYENEKEKQVKEVPTMKELEPKDLRLIQGGALFKMVPPMNSHDENDYPFAPYPRRRSNEL